MHLHLPAACAAARHNAGFSQNFNPFEYLMRVESPSPVPNDRIIFELLGACSLRSSFASAMIPSAGRPFDWMKLNLNRSGHLDERLSQSIIP